MIQICTDMNFRRYYGRKQQEINIFEPILTNAIGLDILGGDMLALAISALQRETLLGILEICLKLKF